MTEYDHYQNYFESSPGDIEIDNETLMEIAAEFGDLMYQSLKLRLLLATEIAMGRTAGEDEDGKLIVYSGDDFRHDETFYAEKG